MTQSVVLFVVGLGLISFGADWLVRGATILAERLGVSSLVIGLTVVAFGTSAPELFVSAAASLDGRPGTAVGNIMGSTAANVGLIVGLGALIRPISVHRRLMVRETPLVIFVLAIVMLLSLNNALGRLDGLALLAGWVLYLVFLLRWGARDIEAQSLRDFENGDLSFGPGATPDQEEASGSNHSQSAKAATKGDSTLALSLFKIAIGLPCLLYGAHWLLDGAETIATYLKVPEPVIAASVVAVGTSLPELAATLVAAFRGMGDLAIGNVIGSNVFNLGLVLGTAALLGPLQLAPFIVVQFVLPALAFSVLLIPLAITGGRVSRPEGALLLTLYILYVVSIFKMGPMVEGGVL